MKVLAPTAPKFGRPRKVDDTEHIATAKRMRADGHTGKDIAKFLGVSPLPGRLTQLNLYLSVRLTASSLLVCDHLGHAVQRSAELAAPTSGLGSPGGLVA
jgi:Helix-turn-helix domain of resolvase